MNKVDLKTLPPSKEFYEGTNEYGGLDIQKTRVRDVLGDRDLCMAASMALALTERCCKLGIGKVYYLGNPAADEIGRDMTDAHKYKLAQLPDLLYQLWVWSEDEQEAWFKTSHYERHILLNAQAECISPADPILEIELVDGVTARAGSRCGDGWETVDIQANRPSPFVFVHALQGAFFGPTADITGGEEYRRRAAKLAYDGTIQTMFVVNLTVT